MNAHSDYLCLFHYFISSSLIISLVRSWSFAFDRSVKSIHMRCLHESNADIFMIFSQSNFKFTECLLSPISNWSLILPSSTTKWLWVNVTHFVNVSLMRNLVIDWIQVRRLFFVFLWINLIDEVDSWANLNLRLFVSAKWRSLNEDDGQKLQANVQRLTRPNVHKH